MSDPAIPAKIEQLKTELVQLTEALRLKEMAAKEEDEKPEQGKTNKIINP